MGDAHRGPDDLDFGALLDMPVRELIVAGPLQLEAKLCEIGSIIVFEAGDISAEVIENRDEFLIAASGAA